MRFRFLPKANGAPLAIRWLALGALLLPVATPAHASNRDDQIYTAAERFKPDGIALLEKLVNIDSGTANAPGVEQVGALLVAELEKLGAQVERVPARPLAGNNIVATFTGTGRGRVLLVAHLDTVWPVGEAWRRPFRIEGNRAFGPGVADDKGGLVAGLGALRVLREVNFKDFATITLLLNTNEETGSIGTRQLMENLARKHDVALNLEAGRPGDKLVIARKGSGDAEVTVKGKSSHAGNAPEAGRNAAMEVAYQMLQLSKLGDPAKGTTINFTVVKAGDRPNVIPDLAVAHADIRAFSDEEFARIERDLNETAKHKLIPDTSVTVTLKRSFPPLLKNPLTDALAARAQPIYAEIERPLDTEAAGGAADSGYTAGVGTPTLDGLGLVGGNGHSLDEYVELDSIVPRVYLLSRLVLQIGAGR
jgi:glutamate carboxypeptidase